MQNKKNLFIVIVIISAIVGSYLFLMRKKPDTSEPVKVNVVIVGTNAEYPPFSLVSENEITGFDIDIIKEACNRLNKRYEIQDKPFDALIPEVQLGKIHVIAAGMTPTAEREKQVFFTRPYYAGDPLIIISPKSAPITSIEQLNGKNVIVNEGFTADRYMSSLNGPSIKRFPAVSEGFLALKSGRGDAFVTAQSAVQDYFTMHDKNNFEIIPVEDQMETYALVVSKKYPELFADLDKVIGDMLEDGTIATLKAKWNLP
jgi:polar amino acid transport system substrate-binding protein